MRTALVAALVRLVEPTGRLDVTEVDGGCQVLVVNGDGSNVRRLTPISQPK